ncbi:alpha/beta hydrolase [bacterium]|nr:alpha/beta hydrolase [bacterium]MBP9808369.1 alpha/beta hydrolase [bacterium]
MQSKFSPKITVRLSVSLRLGLLLTVLLCLVVPVLPNSSGAAQAQKYSNNREIGVFYATTRQNDSPSGRPLYGAARHLDIGLGQGSTEYGVATFLKPNSNIPTIANSPNWSQLRDEMAKRDTYWTGAKVGQLNRLSDSDFFSRVKNFHGLICIYIHGYDMTFEESARELAELADEYERRAPGQEILPILFSWPSTGNKADYTGDEASLEWSETPFRDLINRLAREKSYDTSIDLVAHSMGSRLAFWYAMAQSQVPPGSYGSTPFRNVILSCADIDYHTAEQRKGDLQKCTERNVFVLTNDNDGPLLTSQALHAQTRLGRPADGGIAIRSIATTGNLTASKSADLLSTVNSLFTANSNNADNKDTKSSLAKFALNTFLQKKNSGNNTASGPGQLTESADIAAWLATNPALSREYGPKAQLIDDSGLVTVNMGHRIAWPLLAGLMLSQPTLSPFATSVVHKRPDALLLRQMGDTPTYLYRYNKINLDRLSR